MNHGITFTVYGEEEGLERIYRTAVILRVKLPGLLQTRSSLDLPVVHTRWRALLRSLSSLENYRQASGARLEPFDVLHFLLFNAHTPRSLRHGTAAVKECLDTLAGPGEPSPPARLMGGRAAALTYQGDDIARRGEYVGFLDRVRDDVSRTHDAISALPEEIEPIDLPVFPDLPERRREHVFNVTDEAAIQQQEEQ